MKIKLDENLPVGVADVAAALGHDAHTVAQEGLSGAADDDVMDVSRREGRFLITLDRRLADIRRYPPGSHPGIAVLRLDSQDAWSSIEAVRGLLSNEALGDLTGCLVVVRGHLVRVRRPR